MSAARAEPSPSRAASMSPALFIEIEPRTSEDGGTTAALGAVILRDPELALRSGGGAIAEESGR